MNIVRILEAEKNRLQELADAVRVPDSAFQCAHEAARITEALAIPAEQRREAIRQAQEAEVAARRIGEVSTFCTPTPAWVPVSFPPPVVRLSDPVLRVEIVGWDVPEP